MILIAIVLNDEDDDEGKDEVEDSKRDVLVDASPKVFDESCPCYQVKIEGEEVDDECECAQYGNEESANLGVGFLEGEEDISKEQAIEP